MILLTNMYKIRRLFLLFTFAISFIATYTQADNSQTSSPTKEVNHEQQRLDQQLHNQKILDKIIAIVDNDIVMQSELKQRVNSITGRLRRQGTQLPPISVMEERILEQLILESIQLQRADRAGIRIGDSLLNDTLQNIAQSNKMTLAQFEAQLEQEGDTYANAREQIRREMMITRIQKSEVDRRIRVTELEINNFISSKEGRSQSGAEYLIGHILVALPESASKTEISEAKKKANDILNELKAGEDFKKMAIAKSDGQQALNGGIIGWRKESELPSIAADIIPSLKVNEPSKLILTASGFHIVMVLEKKSDTEKMIEQVQVRHILVSPSEIRTEEEAEKMIFTLYNRLIGGDDFALIAKANSDDPVSAFDGGSLDWVSPGQMVPAFEQVMEQTEIGDISEPFHSDFGWHILQVTDRRIEDMGEIIQKNQAQQIIHRYKFQEELSKWLLEIKGEAYVEIKGKPAKDSDNS